MKTFSYLLAAVFVVSVTDTVFGVTATGVSENLTTQNPENPFLGVYVLAGFLIMSHVFRNLVYAYDALMKSVSDKQIRKHYMGIAANYFDAAKEKHLTNPKEPPHHTIGLRWQYEDEQDIKFFYGNVVSIPCEFVSTVFDNKFYGYETFCHQLPEEKVVTHSIKSAVAGREPDRRQRELFTCLLAAATLAGKYSPLPLQIRLEQDDSRQHLFSFYIGFNRGKLYKIPHNPKLALQTFCEILDNYQRQMITS